jgi:flagellar hook-basal body complex protein FliE
MSVAPVAPTGIEGLAGVSPSKPNEPNLGEEFGKALQDARSLEGEATKMAEKFASGDPSIGIHEVMIASEKANIAIRYATTLKNRAVEAYRELMNTGV